MNQIKGWRTMAFGIGTLVIATVQANLSVIPNHYLPLVMALIGVATIALRLITTGPVGDPMPPPPEPPAPPIV